LVIGPSSGGGGGGGTVDPTTIATTGDVKATYGIGPISLVGANEWPHYRIFDIWSD
jgi:hypothetical protein